MVLDVAIVGSGISGLVANHRIVTRNPKLEVNVFEQAAYIGGRTPVLDGITKKINPGGEFIGAHHHTVIRLASKLKVPVEVFSGDPSIEVVLKNHPTLGDIRFSESSIEDEIDAFLPDDDEEWDEDDEMLYEWVPEDISDRARAYLECVCSSELDCNFEDAWLEDFIDYWEDESETEKFIFTHGTESFVKALANHAEIALKHTLREVIQVNEGYKLIFTTNDGDKEVIARNLILSLPLAALGKIEMNGLLSSERVELINEGQNSYAQIMKVMNTSLPGIDEDFLLVAQDDTSRAGWIYQKGATTTFYGSSEGISPSSSCIHKATGEELARVNAFSATELGAETEKGITALWSSSYARGAYFTGYDLRESLPKAFKVTDKATPNLAFCGEMFSKKSGGYMEGAAETGIRAADKIIQNISG